MESSAPDVEIVYRADQSPREAFDALVLELEDSLGRSGISFEARTDGAMRLADSPLDDPLMFPLRTLPQQPVQ